MLRIFPPDETLNVALKFASRSTATPFKLAATRWTVPELLSAKTVITESFAVLKVLGPEGGGPGVGVGEPGGAISLQPKGRSSDYL